MIGCINKETMHLFLLVGNNPLPNFVAAKMLSKQQSFIHLIHTKSTFHYANKLRKLFVNQLHIENSNIKFIELDQPTDQYSIHNCLQNYVKDEKSIGTGSIGLNYTGGMKSMSVHTYEFLNDWCRQKSREFIFSYLDPINYTMRFSNSDNYSPSFSECQLTMSDLVELHGKTITSSKTGSLFPSFCRRLSLFVANPENMRQLRNWCDSYLGSINSRSLNKYMQQYYLDEKFDHSLLFPDLQSLLDFIKHSVTTGKINQIDEKIVTSAAEKGFSPEVLAIGQIGLALLDSKEIPTDEAHHWNSKSLADSLIKFLDGLWLENFVFTCLDEIAKVSEIHEIKKSIYITNNDPEISSTSFEFDVAAIQGYRLYAISCSTSMSRSLVKSKLFEAFTRAKQMGGDEARVALVSGYLQPGNLLEEINESWMIPRDKVRIFGPQDFVTLNEQLREWFQNI